ncbi:MAG: dihydrofolate reductase [Desulfamplus sp.]|nr:dihydrofolate reductase [Desulfamplus sp.]
MKVILIMAMTLDGKIARHPMEPVDWTGKADKKKFVKITKKAGAVIMGSTTFDTIGKILPDRKNIVMTRDPTRLAMHSNPSGSMQNLNKSIDSLADRNFAADSTENESTDPTGIEGSEAAYGGGSAYGIRSTENGTLEFTDKTPQEILQSLEKEGFESVALIGGSIINSLFAKEHLVDEIYVTLVPKLFGQGLPLLAGDFDINLELVEMEKLDEHSILLKYNVIK